MKRRKGCRRDIERKIKREKERGGMCVCVCVWQRQTERQKNKEVGRDRESSEEH